MKGYVRVEGQHSGGEYESAVSYRSIKFLDQQFNPSRKIMSRPRTSQDVPRHFKSVSRES